MRSAPGWAMRLGPWLSLARAAAQGLVDLLLRWEKEAPALPLAWRRAAWRSRWEEPRLALRW